MTRPRINFQEKTREVTSQDWNVLDELKGKTVEEIRAEQKLRTRPFAVCVLNVTGDLNVGNILRSAVCFGAEKLFILGRRKFDRRGAVGAQNYIDVERIDAIDEEGNLILTNLFTPIYEQGYLPFLFETSGEDITSFGWKDIRRPCLVFGNEGVGIPEEVLDLFMDWQKVRIDQAGVLRSLNVSVAAGIAMHYVSERIV
jgi:tRNA G18 (ribose-2'-O)-methylase SpoU